MKYKIGIFGSAAGDMAAVLPKARKLGKLLGDYKDQIIILTGAGPGLPFVIAQEAASLGVEVWGFSAGKNLEEQKQSAPDVDPAIFKKLIYLPADLPFSDNTLVGRKYRNVTSTATCDAAIIISGRWGSLNEFTNLRDMQKVVGVLTSTGGVADELPALCQKISKEGEGEVLFSSNPKQIVDQVLSRVSRT